MKIRRFALILIISAATLGLAGRAKSDDVVYVDPDSFAAIAYSAKTGNVGVAYNFGDRWSAEKEAIKLCDADDAKVVVWVNNGFCALALGEDKGAYGVGWSWGDGANTRDAKQNALEEADKRTKNTYIKVVACSSNAMKPYIKK